MQCQKETQPVVGSLGAYIDQHPEWTPLNQLVACAAGGQVGFLDDENQPLSMFFYPKLFSTNFKYYETASANVDTGDLNLYEEKEATPSLLFNGFMARFPLSQPAVDRWARVSFISNDTLWYSKPVRYKWYDKPSFFDPDLVQVDLKENNQPIFTWDGEDDGENIIYFQIVADERGDALSATYTIEKMWQYYDLSNVVFNVTRPGPILPLELGKEYQFILMGVSADNWVNTLSSRSFTINR